MCKRERRGAFPTDKTPGSQRGPGLFYFDLVIVETTDFDVTCQFSGACIDNIDVEGIGDGNRTANGVFWRFLASAMVVYNHILILGTIGITYDDLEGIVIFHEQVSGVESTNEAGPYLDGEAGGDAD